MRRIVVIAAGMAGIHCATRIRRRLPAGEVTLVLPSSREQDTSRKDRPQPFVARPVGPVERRLAKLPAVAYMETRGTGLLEAENITPDIENRQVTVGSVHGSLTVRYTDLVVEVPAMVRIPHALRKAENVFSWPVTGFSTEPPRLDEALAQAASQNEIVVVAGGGLPALEALFLVREAGARARWLCTGEKESPSLEPHLQALVLKHLDQDVLYTPLLENELDQLVSGAVFHPAEPCLAGLSLPGGVMVATPCCIWTAPLMAVHPLLRERGVTLDSFGRMELSENTMKKYGVHVMGSGAAVPAASVPGTDLKIPLHAGTEEVAFMSTALTMGKICEKQGRADAPRGLFGVCSACTADIAIMRAGFTQAQAQAKRLDVEFSILGAGVEASAMAGDTKRLILFLLCEKNSRRLIGVQALTLGAPDSALDGLFGMALAALYDGTSIDALANRISPGSSGSLLSGAASILVNKLDGVIKGISPDELLASRDAGADFFTLDLRPFSEWKQGHLLDSCNIPLLQLKKRLQDEVPRFVPLVLVSATGHDAYAVACQIAALGSTDLYVLDGGTDLWPYSLEQGG